MSNPDVTRLRNRYTGGALQIIEVGNGWRPSFRSVSSILLFPRLRGGLGIGRFDFRYASFTASHFSVNEDNAPSGVALRAPLVDLKVDDKKKRLVIMRASGFSLAAIANAIGVKSRQAVSKSLASIPSKYRFDLIADADAPDHDGAEYPLSSALNEAVGSAMNDPDIFEIMLNPDGKLWAETCTSSRKEIGSLSSIETEKIIRFVANKCKIPLTDQAPLIEVDFSTPRARFTGVLPPLVGNPTFSITKIS